MLPQRRRVRLKCAGTCRSPSRPGTVGSPSTGPIKANDAKRLKELENTGSRKLVAESELDKLMLRDIAEGTSDPEPQRNVVAMLQDRFGVSNDEPARVGQHLQPNARPTRARQWRRRATGVAPDLRRQASPVRVATCSEESASRRLEGQRQAGPTGLARTRPERAQAQAVPPRRRTAVGGDVSDRARRVVGDGLPVRRHRRRARPPGSPWQNAWIELFNGLRAELFKGWTPDNLLEPRSFLEDWAHRLQRSPTPQRPSRPHTNRVRPPGSPKTNQHSHYDWTHSSGPLARPQPQMRLQRHPMDQRSSRPS